MNYEKQQMAKHRQQNRRRLFKAAGGLLVAAAVATRLPGAGIPTLEPDMARQVKTMFRTMLAHELQEAIFDAVTACWRPTQPENPSLETT